MIPAHPNDRPWVEDHLRAHLTSSMFPLSNLRQHGWDSDAPRAMRFWIDKDRGAVLGRSNEGFLMPQIPDCDMAGVRAALAGASALGAAGAADQVRALLATLGLDGMPAKLDDDEPQYLLDLRNLIHQPGDGRIVPLSTDTSALATEWRRDYLIEVAGEPDETAAVQAGRDIARFMEADSHRILLVGGVPVSMTGWNSRLPEIVQIGGVYTPPELRGCGHARQALALHLKEMAGEGVTHSTLFASGAAACRAYEALGFRRIGTYSLVLYQAPLAIPGKVEA